MLKYLKNNCMNTAFYPFIDFGELQECWGNSPGGRGDPPLSLDNKINSVCPANLLLGDLTRHTAHLMLFPYDTHILYTYRWRGIRLSCLCYHLPHDADIGVAELSHLLGFSWICLILSSLCAFGLPLPSLASVPLPFVWLPDYVSMRGSVGRNRKFVPPFHSAFLVCSQYGTSVDLDFTVLYRRRRTNFSVCRPEKYCLRPFHTLFTPIIFRPEPPCI